MYLGTLLVNNEPRGKIQNNKSELILDVRVS